MKSDDSIDVSVILLLLLLLLLSLVIVLIIIIMLLHMYWCKNSLAVHYCLRLQVHITRRSPSHMDMSKPGSRLIFVKETQAVQGHSYRSLIWTIGWPGTQAVLCR